eukprot:1160730-Pelagomonas_calceolata.AAC.4
MMASASDMAVQAYRAVLMDQDVLHRLSQPSHHAGRHPRYSLRHIIAAKAWRKWARFVCWDAAGRGKGGCKVVEQDLATDPATEMSSQV